MKRKRRSVSFFRQSLLSYFTLLFFPMLISQIIYYGAFRAIENHIKTYNMSKIEYCMDTIEKNLDAIQDLANNVLGESGVQNFGYYQYDNNNTFIKLVDLCDTIRPYKNPGGTLIESFYIYYSNNNFFISPELSGEAGFISQYLLSINGEPYDAFINSLKGKDYFGEFIYPAAEVNIEGVGTMDIIHYVRSFNRSSKNAGNSYFVVMIDEGAILDMVIDRGIYDEGWFYILDSGGNMITEISFASFAEGESPPPELAFDSAKGFVDTVYDGERMNVVYTVSEKTGWKFVYMIPQSIIMASLMKIRIFTNFITLTCIILGGALVLAFTRRNIAPVREIISLLRNNQEADEDGRRNEYDQIKDHILRVINENRRINKSLAEQKCLLRALFFNRLLRGEINSGSDIEYQMKISGIELTGELFCIAAIKAPQPGRSFGEHSFEDKQDIQDSARIILNNWKKDNEYEMLIDKYDYIVILIYCNYGGPERFRDNIHADLGRMCDAFEEMFHYDVKVGVGGIYNSLAELYISFEQARRVLDLGNGLSESVLWYDEARLANEIYSYPSEFESRLINLCLAGDMDEIRKIIAIIHRENFIERELSAYMQGQLMNEVAGTLHKILGKLNRSNRTELTDAVVGKLACEFGGDEASNMLSGNITECYEMICAHVNANKKSHNDTMKERIEAYIRQNISDPNLSNKTVSDKFNIHESYLSRFFKEQFGVAFSEYMIKMRIEKACDMLKTDPLVKIEEVYPRVGYDNVHSFRRAFKRETGVTPSTYRDISVKDSGL